VYFDQQGNRDEVSLVPSVTSHTLTGLKSGTKYDISVVIQNLDGKISGSASTFVPEDTSKVGNTCVVCHSELGNEACNNAGLTCQTTKNQVCQTVVRASNGLPARFEKRCKQKLACENEKAMFKSSGQCGGGGRYVIFDL
jgi:hypothetical protein